MLRTFLKANIKKQAPRDRCSCSNDMNSNAFEKIGLSASFKGYYRFVRHLTDAVS